MRTAYRAAARYDGRRVGPPATKAAPKRLTGTKVGKYTLKELLGQGAYGEVYAAEQKGGKNVAVKILDATHARDEDAVERFKREGETAKRLEHPNIVRVVDVGSSRARHYLVMELVAGGSLERMMQREGSAEKVLPAITEAARALAYAHGQGVVHRDVKPANILLTRSGRAKVTDFGLARAVDHSSMTTEGRLLGTASYMSPEQVKGERAGAASDVYAVGVMIYEAISGELPFKSDTQIGFLYQHAELAPPRPTVRPPFPNSLAEVALACLEKDPKDRPTMARVAERLARTSLVRPRRWPWILLAAVVIAAVIAGVLLAYGV
jgi:eukaryotic-like serine/threonine-protein kinase